MSAQQKIGLNLNRHVGLTHVQMHVALVKFQVQIFATHAFTWSAITWWIIRNFPFVVRYGGERDSVRPSMSTLLDLLTHCRTVKYKSHQQQFLNSHCKLHLQLVACHEFRLHMRPFSHELWSLVKWGVPHSYGLRYHLPYNVVAIEVVPSDGIGILPLICACCHLVAAQFNIHMSVVHRRNGPATIMAQNNLMTQSGKMWLRYVVMIHVW
jgi:hypothetical protein